MTEEWFESLKYDFRTEFVESWLFESPQRINSTNTWHILTQDLQGKIGRGNPIVNCQDNYKKIIVNNDWWYWHETNNIPDLIVSVIEKNQNLYINMSGKSNIGSPPWMDDAYQFIVNDNNHKLALLSDSKLTDSSIKLWKRMVAKGYNVSVYNLQNPGLTIQKITDPNQVDEFMSNNFDKQNWRFYLNEDNKEENIWGIFSIRRMKERAGTW